MFELVAHESSVSWIVGGISNGVDPKDSSKLSEWRNKIRIVDPDPVSRPSQLLPFGQRADV
jgi:hypothetical protein